MKGTSKSWKVQEKEKKKKSEGKGKDMEQQGEDSNVKRGTGKETKEEKGKERKGKQRKGQWLFQHDGQGEWEQRSRGMIANVALKHMCVVLCQQHTHNYLMTKPAGSILSLVSPCISHSHSGVGSVLTHTHTDSIHQAFSDDWMSEVAAGELGDRCVWQIVASAQASGWHRTSFIIPTDLCYPPYHSLLSILPFHTLSERLMKVLQLKNGRVFFLHGQMRKVLLLLQQPCFSEWD